MGSSSIGGWGSVYAAVRSNAVDVETRELRRLGAQSPVIIFSLIRAILNPGLLVSYRPLAAGFPNARGKPWKPHPGAIPWKPWKLVAKLFPFVRLGVVTRFIRGVFPRKGAYLCLVVFSLASQD